jgi:hypothetical protein
MELSIVELSIILVTAVGVLGLAFAIAWKDASRNLDRAPE